MKKKVIIIAIILLIAAFGIVTYLSRSNREPAFDSGTLHCLLDINDFDNSNVGLITGYNYYLLNKFAEDNGMIADIRLYDASASVTDSLGSGFPDILVLPFDGTAIPDNASVSRPLDSLTHWAVSSESPGKLELINEWITAYEVSEEHSHQYDLFINIYEPFILAKAGKHRSELGPYDSLIRENAEALGWDWRLLAAVIFQESRFRINAKSRTGAFGLMQVVSRTAKSLDIDNLLNPKENIKGGVSYLQKLQKMFRKYASSPTDLQKFTLVAYNIGENKLKDIIEASRQEGQDCCSWEHLEELLHNENISIYIKKIFDYYWAFCRIYRDQPAQEEAMPSGQTEQGQPLQ